MAGDDGRLLEILDEILVEEPLFLAPTYHKERRDKQFIKFALVGVTKAFKRFKYTRAFLGDEGFALEFECNLGKEDGPMMRGVDLVTLNSEGKITRFEVLGLKSPGTKLRGAFANKTLPGLILDPNSM